MHSPRSVIALVPLLVLPLAFLQPRSDEPALKSVHLFDMPAGVTEAELLEAIRQVNSVVTELGYRDAGYKLWRAQTEDPAYGYYWEGLWPSAEAYRSIHDHPRYREAIDAFTDLYPLIEPVQTYVRYVEVSGTDSGGAGAAGLDEAAVEGAVRERDVSVNRAALDSIRAEHVRAVNHRDADLLLESMATDVVYLAPGAAPVLGIDALDGTGSVRAVHSRCHDVSARSDHLRRVVLRVGLPRRHRHPCCRRRSCAQ